MFDTKLAQSVQRDYRQSADTHRFMKTSGSASTRFQLLKSVSTASIFIAMISFFVPG